MANTLEAVGVAIHWKEEKARKKKIRSSGRLVGDSESELRVAIANSSKTARTS